MSRFSPALLNDAQAFLAEAEAAGVLVATAESCTGGLVAALLTEIAGSSSVVECGFVTYSNAAKERMLGVSPAILQAHGAVSEPVARAMAEGALARSGASLAVSITGVAGPGGGSIAKPVGLVHFACAAKGLETTALSRHFGEIGREAVRTASVETALDLLRKAVQALCEPRSP